MPTLYQVPSEDQTGSQFQFPLIEGGVTTVHRDLSMILEDNSLQQLRSLAKKVGLTGISKLKRFELGCALKPWVFFTTAAEATAKYPILSSPLADTVDGLRAQHEALLRFEEEQPSQYIADFEPHFVEKRRLISVALAAILQQEERDRAEASRPPAWWTAGDFVASEDWEEPDVSSCPYLRVVVEATVPNHRCECSDFEAAMNDPDQCQCCGCMPDVHWRHQQLIGCLPLKDPRGANWNFQCPPFDPGWDCASGGSSVCGFRPSVRFVSMTRVQ